MVRPDAFGLPRIEQWLPFFEQPSEKRSTEDWYCPIENTLKKFGLKVRHLVSDRASALIKLGKSDYLDVCSMPDLFHFNQSLAIRAGAYIGRVLQKATKQYREVKASGVYYSQRKPSEDKFLFLDMCQRLYRQSMNQINQVVHPFDKQGWLLDKTLIKHTLHQNIAKIEKQLIDSKAVSRSKKVGVEPSPVDKSKDSLPVEVHLKLGKQVTDIVQGIESWQEWTKQRLADFCLLYTSPSPRDRG